VFQKHAHFTLFIWGGNYLACNVYILRGIYFHEVIEVRKCAERPAVVL